MHFEEPRESKIHKRNSLFWYILTLPFHRRNLYTPTEGVLIPIFNISGTILSLLILILGRLVTIHSLGSWNPNFPSVQWRSALQRSALRRSVLWRSALWRSALRRSARRRSAMWRSALRRSALQRSVLRRSTQWRSAMWRSAQFRSALWRSALCTVI